MLGCDKHTTLFFLDIIYIEEKFYKFCPWCDGRELETSRFLSQSEASSLFHGILRRSQSLDKNKKNCKDFIQTDDKKFLG